MVLKGLDRWYLTGALKKQSGEDAFKVALPAIDVFGITDVLPADIRQDNHILSVEAPCDASVRKSEFITKLRNPFKKQLESGILSIRIEASEVVPRWNLEVKDGKERLDPRGSVKEIAISMSSQTSCAIIEADRAGLTSPWRPATPLAR